MKPLMQMLADGYELHIKHSGLTEFRTLVKGDLRLKGVKQAEKAKLARGGVIEKKRSEGPVDIWGLTTWGEVLAKHFQQKEKP